MAEDKTWKNYKKLFSKAYHEMNEQQQLSAGAPGFHEANSAANIGTALEYLTTVDWNIT